MHFYNQMRILYDTPFEWKTKYDIFDVTPRTLFFVVYQYINIKKKNSKIHKIFI